MKIKIKPIFIIIIGVFVLCVFAYNTIAFFDSYNGYWWPIGVIWCTSEWTCLHEVGHEKDYEGGWPSLEPQFAFAARIAGATKEDLREVYADTYANWKMYGYLPYSLRAWFTE